MLNRRLLRINVVKSLFSYLNSSETRLQRGLTELAECNDKCYELYLELLDLIVQLRDYNKKKIEASKSKHVQTQEDINPNLKFIDNQVVQAIEDSLRGCKDFKAKGIWNENPELIAQLWDEMSKSEYFANYMSATQSQDFESDKAVVLGFYNTHIEDNEAVENIVEESSLYWASDLIYNLILVIKNIEELKFSNSNQDSVGVPRFKLSSEYKNEQDKEFAMELLTKSILNVDKYLQYIDEFAVNWDLERIAFMDKVLMIVALAELLNFPTIPTKVTIDEYIEISKYYSSPSSSIFINGIIDKAARSLMERGEIVKSGRGLI